MGNFLSRKFPNWYEKGHTSKKNWADPEVISYAKIKDISLVTQEAWNANAISDIRFKIPTICSKIGAYCHIRDKYDEDIKNYEGFKCIDFLELIKRENLHITH